MLCVEFLVRLSVFKELEAVFLPEGYTHENIKQGFSMTSSHLHNNDAIILFDLHNGLKRPQSKYM